MSFTTIYPACYDGRWPHIHFEVYPSLAKATNSSNKIATSQMALTEAASKAVYATTGYEQSVQNLSQVSLGSDNVFGDGYDLQIPEIRGDPTAGYTLNFTCAVWSSGLRIPTQRDSDAVPRLQPAAGVSFPRSVGIRRSASA